MRLFGFLTALAYIINLGRTDFVDCYHEPGVMQFHACCDIPFTSQINEQCKHEIIKRSRNEVILEAEIIRNELTFEMCTAECEYKAKNYLFGSSEIDFESVKRDLESCFPREFVYIRNIIKGMHDCLEYARNRALSFFMEGYTVCNFFPGLLRKCAFHAAIRNCSLDRWHFSESCIEIKNWLDECNVLKNIKKYRF